jgi:hypothetical protein
VVVVGGSETGVDEVVALEVRRQGQAKQPPSPVSLLDY